jgi:hypothetical protein
MEAGAARSQSFDHLRENSIGLPQVLLHNPDRIFTPTEVDDIDRYPPPAVTPV